MYFHNYNLVSEASEKIVKITNNLNFTLASEASEIKIGQI